MTAATTTRINEISYRVPHIGTIPSAANQLFYRGTLVALNASGQAVVPTDGDGFEVIGVSAATYDNRTGSDAGGLAGDIEIQVDYGLVEVECADTVHEGDLVYSLDNQTVSASSDAGARKAAGVVCQQHGSLIIWVGPMVRALALLEARIDALEP